MIKRVNIEQEVLAVCLITIIVTLISMISMLISEHIINAQMITENRSEFGNMNTSLSQAMITAEKSVGNNSFTIAGFGINGGGHLAYTIIVGTHGPEFYNVTVDPTNGQVLATAELTQKELEERHLEHSLKVLTEPHLMNNTFVH
jgi:hypothetical protein